MADPALADYDDTVYAARAYWAPTNYTNIGLYASLTTEESIEFVSPYIESELVGANLQHSFTDRFRGNVFWNEIEDDVVNIRMDEITEYGVGIYYDLTRWLSLGAYWKQSTRDSTDPIAEYEYESLGFTLGLRGRRDANFGNLHTGISADARTNAVDQTRTP